MPYVATPTASTSPEGGRGAGVRAAGGSAWGLGGLVVWYFGVDAERRSLEDIAAPLSLVKEKVSAARYAVKPRQLRPEVGT